MFIKKENILLALFFCQNLCLLQLTEKQLLSSSVGSLIIEYCVMLNQFGLHCLKL